MHFVVGDVFGFHRQESACADMQGQEGVWNSGKNLGREVQSGRGSRHRAWSVRIDSLVAFVVELFGLPLEIGRQWHVAVLFEIGCLVELHDALTARQHIDDFRSCSGDLDACAGS